MAVFFWVFACSSPKTVDLSSINPENFEGPGATVVEVLQLTETDDFFFGNIAAVQPTRRGHILVGDGSSRTFHIFDANGNRIDDIDEDNHLWLVFTHEGEFLKHFHLKKGTTIHRIVGDRLYTSESGDEGPMVRVYQLS